MMVAERATAPESAAPCSDQNNQGDDITMCAFCGADRDVYQLGDGQYICEKHLAESVSLAACDVWPDLISYSRAFEQVLM